MIATVFFLVYRLYTKKIVSNRIREARNAARCLKRDSEGYLLEGIDQPV